MSGNKSITIRIWNGCTVRQVLSISDTSAVTIGAVGGASNSTQVDIEFDPWAGLIVDNRDQHPTPISIVEPEDDEEPDLGQEYDRRKK